MSENGDYVGAGQSLYFTTSDGSFLASQGFPPVVQRAPGQSAEVPFSAYSHGWGLRFAAASGGLLVPGVYADASDFWPPYNRPSLHISGDGRGCGRNDGLSTGSFTVIEATYGPDREIVSFRASFEQRCYGATAALRGEVRYNASVPIEISAPMSLVVLEQQPVQFAVGAVDAAAAPVWFSTGTLPPGASFSDHGNGTATLRGGRQPVRLAFTRSRSSPTMALATSNLQPRGSRSGRHTTISHRHESSPAS